MLFLFGVIFFCSTQFCHQTRLTLSADLFDEFVHSSSDKEIHFSIKFLSLYDCLRLFGISNDTTTAIMSFSVSYCISCLQIVVHVRLFKIKCEEAIFKLSLEESGALTICDISTVLSEEVTFSSFQCFVV